MTVIFHSPRTGASGATLAQLLVRIALEYEALGEDDASEGKIEQRVYERALEESIERLLPVCPGADSKEQIEQQD